MAINKTSQPKLFLSFSPSINLLIYNPAPIPKIEKKQKALKKTQSIFNVVERSPVKPINDFTEIIINDVPTAFFIDKPPNKTKAGIIKKPPPAPTNPVNTPTNKPSKVIAVYFVFFLF